MKLCACNECGGMFEDMNPQTGALEYPDEIPVDKLRWFSVDFSKPEEDYLGCPVCCTDAALTDDIQNHVEKNRVALLAGLVLCPVENEIERGNLAILLETSK